MPANRCPPDTKLPHVPPLFPNFFYPGWVGSDGAYSEQVLLRAKPALHQGMRHASFGCAGAPLPCSPAVESACYPMFGKATAMENSGFQRRLPWAATATA